MWGYLSTFKKSNPQKTVITRAALCIVLLIVIVAMLVVFGADVTLFVLIAVDILILAIDCFMYFGLPRIQYASLANMKDAENVYIFCDRALKTFAKSVDYTAEAEMEYFMFVKAYETAKYFFLYQTNNQVFIVDKATIENGTAEEIRNVLRGYMKEKYMICKY